MHAKHKTSLAEKPSGRSFTSARKRREVLSALRRVLDELPLHHRQMIALHVAGGLSQEEIAAELCIQSHTVKDRITSAMDQIQSDLASFGFDDDQQIKSSIIGEAICSGYPVPPRLVERVLQGVNHRSPEWIDRLSPAQNQRVILVRVAVSLLTVASSAALLWIMYGTSLG